MIDARERAALTVEICEWCQRDGKGLPGRYRVTDPYETTYPCQAHLSRAVLAALAQDHVDVCVTKWNQ